MIVPADLAERFGRREITRSLGTSRHSEAHQKLILLKANAFRLIAMARANPKLSQAELEALARRYFDREIFDAEGDRLGRRIRSDADCSYPYGSLELEASIFRELAEQCEDDLAHNNLTEAKQIVADFLHQEDITPLPGTREQNILASYVLRANADINQIMAERVLGNINSKPRDPLFASPEPPRQSPVLQDGTDGLGQFPRRRAVLPG